MKAKDAVLATATVLSRMSPQDRAAVARVLTMPGKVELITRDAIFADVKTIATRSVNEQVLTSKVDDLVSQFESMVSNASQSNNPNG